MTKAPEQIYEALDRAYFSSDMHEKRELELLPRLLRRADAFVDVGASLGQYTLHASRALSGARLLAIEADPIRFARLRDNCDRWERDSSNRIRAIHAAASDRPGSLTFQSTQSEVSGGVFRRDLPGVAWHEVTVPAVTLDEVVAEHLGASAGGVIKIDVEGGEYRALLGARRLLAAGRFRFLVELHSWGDPGLGKRPEDVVALFAAAGYRAERLHHHHLFERAGRLRLGAAQVRRVASRARAAARALAHPRRAATAVRFAAAARGMPLTDNERRLRALRDRHRGGRVWVVGNGPSLRGMDLTRLRDEPAIASNGIFLLYPDTPFRPRYYTVEDVLVAEDRAAQINALDGCTKVVPHDLRRCIAGGPDTIFVDFRRAYDGFPRFSDDLLRRAFWGGTVTFFNLQLAHYLGAKQICLIGVDHDYAPPAASDGVAGSVITSASPDRNHFHPGYFGPGYRWHTPQVERMERAYREAARFLAARGVEVLNATAGGKLEVFARASFGELTRGG